MLCGLSVSRSPVRRFEVLDASNGTVFVDSGILLLVVFVLAVNKNGEILRLQKYVHTERPKT